MGRMPAPQTALTLGRFPVVGWRAEFTNNAPIILIAGLIISRMERCTYMYRSTFSVCFLCVRVFMCVCLYMCVYIWKPDVFSALQVSPMPRAEEPADIS